MFVPATFFVWLHFSRGCPFERWPLVTCFLEGLNFHPRVHPPARPRLVRLLQGQNTLVFPTASGGHGQRPCFACAPAHHLRSPARDDLITAQSTASLRALPWVTRPQKTSPSLRHSGERGPGERGLSARRTPHAPRRIWNAMECRLLSTSGIYYEISSLRHPATAQVWAFISFLPGAFRRQAGSPVTAPLTEPPEDSVVSVTTTSPPNMSGSFYRVACDY